MEGSTEPQRPLSTTHSETMTDKQEPTGDSKSLKLNLKTMEDNTSNVPVKKKVKQKPEKKLNPYENTNMAAIKLLRKRQRVSKKTTVLPRDQYGPQEDAIPPTSPNDVTQRTEEHDVSGRAGDTTGRQSTLPPVLKQRYQSASLRSLYMREDERNRRSKGSAGTRKSNSLVWEMGGGSLLTYTGVQRMKKESLEESTRRLAIHDADKVPDAQRTLPPKVTEKCGLTASFQWTAGGQRCHGFMW